MQENRYKKLREDFEFTPNGYRMTAENLAEIFKKRGYDTLTHSAIRKIETDSRKVSEYELKGYCEVFGTTSDYLLGLSNTASIEENIIMISRTTGLSDKAIDILKKSSDEDKIILNALIEEDNGLDFLKKAIENFYRQSFQIINIRGFGTQKDIDKTESAKIFDYISNQFMHDFFNILVHNKSVTNKFAQTTFNEYINSSKRAITTGNASYEQTPERTEGTEKILSSLDSSKKENSNTNYFEEWSKPDASRKKGRSDETT